MSDPLVDRAATKELLAIAVPQWTAILEHLEESGGRLEFRSDLPEAIANLKIAEYPRLYEGEQSAGKLICFAMLGKQDAADFDHELTRATPSSRGETIKELGEVLVTLEPTFNFDLDAEAKAEELKAYEALPPDAQQEAEPTRAGTRRWSERGSRTSAFTTCGIPGRLGIGRRVRPATSSRTWAARSRGRWSTAMPSLRQRTCWMRRLGSRAV